MKRRALLAILIIATLVVLPSRLSATPGIGVYDLAVELKDNGSVVLEWKETAGLTGSLAVYRSKHEIVDRLPPSARLIAQVPAGALTCVDQPEGAGPWYYLVLPESKVQAALASLPPGTSITRTAIKIPVLAQPVNETTSSNLDRTASFSNMYATVEGEAIYIHFIPLVEEGRAVLYRSTLPVRSIEDLVHAVIIHVGPPKGPFVDYPVPGIECWYALILEEDIRKGVAGIFSGQNATSYAVEVRAGPSGTGGPRIATHIRSMPLPLISRDALADMIQAWPSSTARRQELSPAAAAARAELLSRGKRPLRSTPRRPQLFQQDLSPSEGGEAWVLHSIVADSFRAGRWEESADALGAFLSLPRSAEAENRGRFYLGQSWYFRGDYRLALFEFLLSHRSYPVEANAWIQECLGQLSKNVWSSAY